MMQRSNFRNRIAYFLNKFIVAYFLVDAASFMRSERCSRQRFRSHRLLSAEIIPKTIESGKMLTGHSAIAGLLSGEGRHAIAAKSDLRRYDARRA
ncbi:hypothetical protein ASD00_05215 [Ensifer sp. Root31]|jgi:hypothetical protein|uniref:hypothetical protein n=1 Tax=Ensifer TaxID=106591 RepID=UPI00070A4870|nr:hypothetical protein [Ensifer sp. Root31]KQU90752.1 hypothetical protein ASD00_05215 [Ensifer sp. Root31]MDP9629424.1 hypothetical protein [Ensifer adhaerens]